MGMDLIEAIAILVQRVADRVRAPPERRIENIDVLVDQRLLVALEDLAQLFDNLGNVWRQISLAHGFSLGIDRFV
jgi:antitoxin component of RelBE/YafQ-DinJ toxin-antitoxin module